MSCELVEWQVHRCDGVCVHGPTELEEHATKYLSYEALGAYAFQHFQMRERQQLSVVTACSTVRKYRYGVMRNRVCYTVMLEAILRFAAGQGYVNGHSSAFLRALEVICNSLNTSALRYTYDDSSL